MPPAVSLGGAARLALSDLYYHSWRIVPANVVWAVVAFGIAAAAWLTPLGLVVLPILALPTAGIFRVTTRIARGEAVSFWDAIDAWRTDVRTTLGLGIGVVLVAGILGANTVIGLSSASPLGWGIATLAAWGLIVLWLLLWTVWPIVVDPLRAVSPLRNRLRLAALLLLAHPIRIGLLGLALAVLLVVSAVAVAALAVVSVGFAALVASRYVLPAADRLEERLTSSVPALG